MADSPTLDSVETPAFNSDTNYDPIYEKEVNQLLDEIEEELLHDKSEKPSKHYDYHENFHHDGSIHIWYKDKLKKKEEKAKNRITRLRNFVCAACPSTAAYIDRIEKDCNTIFCKSEPTRYPPLDKPWANSWELNYKVNCKEILNDPYHSHTIDCQSISIIDSFMKMSIDNSNFSRCGYPEHVIHAAELFQDFAKQLTKDKLISDSDENVNTVYEEKLWTSTTLFFRSNNLNKMMIIVSGDNIDRLIPHLKEYFEIALKRTPKRYSIICATDKIEREEILIAGIPEIKDKVGPLLISYNLSTHGFRFNSVETMQLAKLIQDYMNLTKDITLLDIGCNFGVLSLIMAHICGKVIGLNTGLGSHAQFSEAEDLKRANRIHNVSFVHCTAVGMLTKCSPLIENCMAVAILDLSGPYAKSRHVMQALRCMSNIWQIIIYGSFDDKFHENIAVLTSEDTSVGERYLPVRGCVSDYFPTIVSGFDIVILFERESIIDYQSESSALRPPSNVQEIRSESPIITPPERFLSQIFPPDPLPPNRNELPKNYPPSLLKLKLSKPSLLPDSHQPARREFQNNFPSAPLKKFSNLAHPSHPHPSAKNKLQNKDSSPPLENFFVSSVPRQTSVSVNEESQVDHRSVPKERRPSSPIIPLPEETTLIKKYGCDNSSSATVQVTSEEQNEDKKDIKLEVEDDDIFCVYIKSKPTESNHSAIFSEANCENKPVIIKLEDEDSSYAEDLSAMVKTEPFQSREDNENRESNIVDVAGGICSVPIKSEPIDSSISNSLSEVNSQNMPLPITIKSEPLDLSISNSSSEVNSQNMPLPVTNQSEPVGPSISNSLSQVNSQNMPLPITIKLEPLDLSISNSSSGVNSQNMPLPVTIQSEPVDSNISNTLSEVNSQIMPLPMTIKSEPVDLSFSNSLSETNCQNTTVPVTIKSEPADSSTLKSFSEVNSQNITLPVTINMSASMPRAVSTKATVGISVSLVENDQTFLDINKRALNNKRQSVKNYVSGEEIKIVSQNKSKLQNETPIHNPKSLSDNTSLAVTTKVTMDDLEFAVQTGRSFLDYCKSNSNDKRESKKKHEESDDWDEEIKIVGEIKSKRQKKSSSSHVKRRKRTPSPEKLPRQYRIRSPSPRSKRRRRSPSTKRHRRSPSPSRKRRRRSPSSSDKYKRKALSPVMDRQREKKRWLPPFIQEDVYGLTNAHHDRQSRRSRSRSPRRW